MSVARPPTLDKLKLWQDYREAFKDFARTVDYVQSLKQCANPSEAAIEAALLERERAYACYEACRDALAAALLSDSSRNSVSKQAFMLPHQNPDRVKDIAEWIWELENRPEGKADDDWFRAEDIFRRAMESQPIQLAAGPR